MNRGRKEAKGGVSSTVKPEKELSLVLVTQTWPISETCQRLEHNFTKCNYYMKTYQSISGFLSIPFLRRVTWLRKRKKKFCKTNAIPKVRCLHWIMLCGAFTMEEKIILNPWTTLLHFRFFFLLAEFEDTIAWFFNSNNFI